MRVDHVTCHPDIGVKLATKHGVDIEECDEVFHDSPTYRLVEAGRVEGENLYYVGGQTDAGRYLSVYFIHKGRGVALVISARDMAPKEKRLYGKAAKSR